MPVEKSYVLVNRVLLSDTKEEIVGNTGKRKTVRRSTPRYRTEEIDDGEGNMVEVVTPDGRDRFEVEVEVKVGGYATIGKTDNDQYSAVILKSPRGPELRQLAATGSYVEIYTYDPDYIHPSRPRGPQGDELEAILEADPDYVFETDWEPYLGIDDEFDANPGLNFAAQNFNAPAGLDALGRLNFVIAEMGIGIEPATGPTYRDVIESLFSQFRPGWRVGMDDI